LGKPLRYLLAETLAGLDGFGCPNGIQSIYRTAKNEFLSATGWTIVEDVLRQSWAQMTVAGTLLGD